MPIAYPERNESRLAFRRVLEALAQATPVTAALAHLYGYTHPSLCEQDLERLQREIAETVNDHDERLIRLEARMAPRAVLNELALDIAFHTLRTNDTGREAPVIFDALEAAFPSTQKALLEEAIAELAHNGYVTTSAAMGHPIHLYRPTRDLFLAFDMATTGNNTRADAIEIAQIWLVEDETWNIHRLEERLGWPVRRLNPALWALKPVFPEGRWSREIHPTLATTAVLISPEERFKLRQMVTTGRVD